MDHLDHEAKPYSKMKTDTSSPPKSRLYRCFMFLVKRIIFYSIAISVIVYVADYLLICRSLSKAEELFASCHQDDTSYRQYVRVIGENHITITTNRDAAFFLYKDDTNETKIGYSMSYYLIFLEDLEIINHHGCSKKIPEFAVLQDTPSKKQAVQKLKAGLKKCPLSVWDYCSLAFEAFAFKHGEFNVTCRP